MSADLNVKGSFYYAFPALYLLGHVLAPQSTYPTLTTVYKVQPRAQVDKDVLVGDAQSSISKEALYPLVVEPPARQCPTHVTNRGQQGHKKRLLNQRLPHWDNIG